MQQREKHENASFTSQPIVVVHQIPSGSTNANKGKGYYADNLAFSYEDEALLTTYRPASDVYAQLSHSVQRPASASVDEVDGRQNIRKCLLWKAVISGCMLAACIIIFYLWINVRYINPMFVEIFKISPPQNAAITSEKETHFIQSVKSEWMVKYDLPSGIPLLKLHAKEMKNFSKIDCPSGKFALALYLDSDSELAENWLEACGNNVAYFRIDGNPTPADVERLIIYLKDAQFLPLKATARVEKYDDLLDNKNFQKTRLSDEVIKSVEISGYVTSKTIEEIIDAVPYAEELTIKGSEVCKSLHLSLETSKKDCKLLWQDLQKLHIIETEECRGMYDLIYSCWDMPQIEILQIRKSVISGPNSDYIKAILDRHRIMKVDFADNICFDETLRTFPFMCQSSS